MEGRPQKRPAAALLLGLLIGVMPTTAGEAAVLGQTTRVSLSSSEAEGNGVSSQPSISADGRFVAFSSQASSLVPGDTNGVGDIFVHDRQTRETERVSVSSTREEANGLSRWPAISGDGQFVAFYSEASNLVPGDTNGVGDIFVHDRQTGETERVSVSSAGEEASGFSLRPTISGDGRLVAFDSFASNLVPDDTNGVPDIFVRDRVSGVTTRVSVSSAGAQGNGPSFAPSISGDGRYVAFESDASNLVEGATNGRADVFVHDRVTGQTERVSVSFTGDEGQGHSRAPAISEDGRLVAFQSFAPNLVPDDRNRETDIFLRDRNTAETTRVSVSSTGEEANRPSFAPSTSGDGRYVAFESGASNLVPETSSGTDVFVYDRVTGQTRLASVSFTGGAADAPSTSPSIAGNASNVAFASGASNLVDDDGNDVPDAFVHTLTGQYFALGDGIAAGLGLPGASGECRQSPAAYPFRVADLVTGIEELHHLACAGATTDDLDGQVNQVLALRDVLRPALVSITVGLEDLGLSTPIEQREILCEKPDGQFRQDAVGSDGTGGIVGRIRENVREALGRLLADPAISVVVSELYQPFNAHPSYLDDYDVVGGRAFPCDGEYPASRRTHKAQERAEFLVSHVNDALLGVATSLSEAERRRFRVAPIQRVFEGREAARPNCGAREPEVTQTWIQHPGAGASEGACLYPNLQGALIIGASLTGAVPTGAPPADEEPPTISFHEPTNPVRLGDAGQLTFGYRDSVSGRVLDEGSGVASLTLTFNWQPAAESGLALPWSPFELNPEMNCQPHRRSCRFDVPVPEIPGVWVVGAEATDLSGNVGRAETTIVVV